jgi:CelD/BcsL family acetyltransferase involved in cellulose biosynthesis
MTATRLPAPAGTAGGAVPTPAGRAALPTRAASAATPTRAASAATPTRAASAALPTRAASAATPTRAASAGVPAAPPAGWTVETRRDDGALTALGRDWDGLLARCAAATPFQTHAWLESWWRRYGRAGRLRLVLVRRDGRLVAAAALHLRRRWCATVATPLGAGLSDFTDVLTDDELAGPAARVLVAGLLRHPDWDVLDLPEARPGSAAGALPRHWPGRHWELAGSTCLELPAIGPAALIRALPTHARKTVRRRVNQIERVPVQTRAVPAARCPGAVAGLLAMHARQWQGRAVNPAHLRPAFARHLARAVPAMVAAGQAALLEYTVDERVVAANLVLVGPALAGGYLYGAEPDLRDRIDISTLLVTSTLAEAQGRGCAAMSMLRGTEPYKARWRPAEVVNRRLLLVRPGSRRGLGFAAGVRVRAAALGAARRHAPWLRAVRDTARRALRRMRRA